KFATIVACAAGSRAKTEPLKKLTNTVVSLDTMDSSSFDQFFKWVSNSVSSGNMSMGATTDLALPPPPTEVNVVV
ncbi:MAG: tellurium resistance protein TerY, partial [Planctomycetota bacterium]